MIGTRARSAPSRLRDLEALHVGQHHVEQHHVRARVADLRERLGAGAGRGDLEALVAQRHRDHVDDVRLVVDDEHARRAAAVLVASMR